MNTRRTQFPTYDHCDVSDADVEAALATDKVIQKYILDEEDYKEALKRAEEYGVQAKAEVNKIDLEINDLEGLIKAKQRERREAMGAQRSALYKVSLAQKHLRQLDTRWKRRELHVYSSLITSKLRTMRTELSAPVKWAKRHDPDE